MSETTVVYIAGCGRSGSTVLDLALGRGDGWFSMGEFRLFWHALRDHWRCGCGQQIGECPFWSAVLADLPCDPADVLAGLKATVRLRRTGALMYPTRLGGETAATARLNECLRAVYRGTASAAGASVLVDSSKDALYGLALANALDARLHVVHLVRDSRAVAWSWQRKRRRPEVTHEDAYMPRRTAVRASLDWDLRNAIVHLLRQRVNGYTRVTYEAFTADPHSTVARIRAAVGAECGQNPAVEAAAGSAPSKVATTPQHTVAGNPVRFSADALEVTTDVEWKSALPRADKRTVTAMTLPLLLAYGYVGRAGGSA